jgi:hypothetical protein
MGNILLTELETNIIMIFWFSFLIEKSIFKKPTFFLKMSTIMQAKTGRFFQQTDRLSSKPFSFNQFFIENY